jgi:hypothetical protein
MTIPVNCPKGEKQKIRTREPRGTWCVTGYKVIACSCGCLKVSVPYHKGGDAWRTAERNAIKQWNLAVTNFPGDKK